MTKFDEYGNYGENNPPLPDAASIPQSNGGRDMSDFPDTAYLFAGGEWSSVPAHETADNVTCEAYVPASRLDALTAERDALRAENERLLEALR